MNVVNANEKNGFGRVIVSLALLAIDYLMRFLRSTFVRLSGPAVSVAWIATYGIAFGLTFALGLLCVEKVAAFAPTGVQWRDVVFVWAVAVIVAATFGILLTVLRTITNAGLSIVSRIADLAARPIVIEQMAAQAEKRQKPLKSKPGAGEFVPYSDGQAYVNQMREDLIANGVSAENVGEILKDVGRGAEV